MSVLSLNCLYHRPTFLPYLIIFLSFWKIFNSVHHKTQLGCDPALRVDNTFVYFAAEHRLPALFRIYFDFILLSPVGLGPDKLP